MEISGRYSDIQVYFLAGLDFPVYADLSVGEEAAISILSPVFANFIEFTNFIEGNFYTLTGQWSYLVCSWPETVPHDLDQD